VTPRCLNRLQEVHPDLQKVILHADSLYPGEFIVTEGKRSIERQQYLFDTKKSKTMRSRHVPESNACKMPCAVDLAVMNGSDVTWDFKKYKELAAVVKQAAKAVGVPIEWGGDWKTFLDGPHFQLPWKEYP
jgi:peptidoglycan L-alanyl-D-glutamate endopeptidase CwlK